jgi:hypothetical protein
LEDLPEASGALRNSGSADGGGDCGEHSYTDKETRRHDQPF